MGYKMVDDGKIEENDTFIVIVRSGERPKAGEEPQLAHRLGHLFQVFLAQQGEVANARRDVVKGSITVKFDFATALDGSHHMTVSEKVVRAKMPALKSTIFTDDDGELTSRPREPLTDWIEKENEKKSAGKVPSCPE